MLAGKLLGTTEPSLLHAEVIAVSDPLERWYRALWYMGGPHDSPMVASVKKDGIDIGHVFAGSVQSPAAASSALSLHFQAQAFAPVKVEAPASRQSVVHWLEEEKRKRGVLWVVLAAVASLVLAALALR